jgi:GntR family transcriptional repressor for pyruvate dehydrogenase complex
MTTPESVDAASAGAGRSMASGAESRLEKMILSGELKIGDQLPTERQLAELLGVSRGVVHAGIAELAGKGFLRIAPRHGVYVADYIKNGTLDVLNSIALCGSGEIDRELAGSIIWTRFALEYLPVTELAAHHTDEQIKRLEMMLGEMRAKIKRGDESSGELAERIQEFFLERCVMYGNLVLPIIVNASSGISTVLTKKWIEAVGADRAVGALESTMKRIAEGDPEGAAASMRRNITSAFEALEK